jgi:hypothetical protein
MRWRIAEPPFGLRPGIGSNALIALLDELQDIIRADVLNLMQRRRDALALVRHGWEIYSSRVPSK